MSDKSDFSDEEWKALTEAPLLVTVTMFAAGEHGPISMMKESAASARLLAQPGDRGDANALIREVVPVAKSHEARKDVEHHKGANMAEIVADCLNDLKPAAAAVKKLPEGERVPFAAWLYDMALEVANASKGVSASERDTLDKIAALFGVPT